MLFIYFLSCFVWRGLFLYFIFLVSRGWEDVEGSIAYTCSSQWVCFGCSHCCLYWGFTNLFLCSDINLLVVLKLQWINCNIPVVWYIINCATRHIIALSWSLSLGNSTLGWRTPSLTLIEVIVPICGVIIIYFTFLFVAKTNLIKVHYSCIWSPPSFIRLNTW